MAKVASLRSENEELRRENELLHKQLERQSTDEASTTLIDFDDVLPVEHEWSASIPNGYHGLNWENWHVLHRSSCLNWEGCPYAASYLGDEPSSISSEKPFSVVGWHGAGMNVLPLEATKSLLGIPGMVLLSLTFEEETLRAFTESKSRHLTRTTRSHGLSLMT